MGKPVIAFRGDALRWSRVGGATLWTLGSRIIGLGWTVLLLTKVGLADYGLYAMAYSMSSIVAGIFDNPWYIRSVRVDDVDFESDRSTRALLAVVLTVAGISCLHLNPVVWIALLIAAGETSLGAVKAAAHRAGDVRREAGLDAARQIVSVTCGAFAALVTNSGLTPVAFGYLVPYGCCTVYVLTFVRGASLRRPPIREIVTLAGTALAGAGYAQGDVVVLGISAGSRAAGSYALASLIAWALASVSMQWVNSHSTELRTKQKVEVNSAALTRISRVLGLLCLAGSALVYVILANAAAAWSLLLLTPFVIYRSKNYGLSLSLIFGHEDSFRALATVVAAVCDLLLVALLVPSCGVLAAPMAASTTELLLFTAFRWRTRTALTPTDRHVGFRVRDGR